MSVYVPLPSRGRRESDDGYPDPDPHVPPETGEHLSQTTVFGTPFSSRFLSGRLGPGVVSRVRGGSGPGLEGRTPAATEGVPGSSVTINVSRVTKD